MKRGRPAKSDNEKVKNKLIAIDLSDYKKLKIYCLNKKQNIKVVIHELLKDGIM